MRSTSKSASKRPVKSGIRSKIVKVLSYLTLGEGKAIRRALSEIPHKVTEDKLAFIVHATNRNSSMDFINPASDLIGEASNFRRKKALMKKLAGALLSWPAILIFLILPGYYASNYSNDYAELSFWQRLGVWIAAYSIGILALATVRTIMQLVLKFQVKTGRIVSIVFRFLVIITPHIVLFYNYDSITGWTDLFVNWALLVLIIPLNLAILFYVCSEVLTDVYFYSAKIHLTDALVLESVYQLAIRENWSETMRIKRKRNEAINEIDRLATLIETDWSSHTNSGDPRTDRWKRKTLRGIANGVRLLKRQLIVPGPDSGEHLRQRFNELLVHLLNNNMQGFIDASVPAERIKKKTIFSLIQHFIIAILPLAIGIGLCKYFSDMVGEQYRGIFMAVGIGWLIVCILLWLDPRLPDKVSMMKRGKGMLNPLAGGE